MPLTVADTGEEYVIKRIGGKPEVKQHLENLGFVVGSVVSVINTISDLPQTKLIASHDLDMILDTCQRVILLSHGKIVADGDAETILRDRELLEANRMELPFCLQGWHGGSR